MARVWRFSGVNGITNKTTNEVLAGITRMAKGAGLEPAPFMLLTVSQYAHKLQMLFEMVSTGTGGRLRGR